MCLLNIPIQCECHQSIVLAALPPQYQEANEKKAIQEHPRLTELLGNQIVQEIRKICGGYLVVTDLCTLQVDVHYLPREDGLCGPARFALVFHEPFCYSDLK